MLIFNNVREIAIAVLSFMLWSWYGVLISFVLLFALNILESWCAMKLRTWLNHWSI